MIDSEMANNFATNKLKILKIDSDKFFSKNLPMMENYLVNTYLPNWHKTNDTINVTHTTIGLKPNQITFSGQDLSLNQQGQIKVITNTDDQDRTVLCGRHCLNIAKGHLSNHDWARKIINHYYKWLKSQIKKQSQMSFIDLMRLLKGNGYYDLPKNILFFKTDYINFIMGNIESLAANEIYLPWCNNQEFYSKLIIILNSIKRMKSSFAFMLFEDLLQNNEINNFTKTILVQKLYSILTQKDTKIILVTDKVIDQALLLTYIANNNTIATHNVTLPISQLFNFVTLASLDVFINSNIKVNFVIANEKDLHLFLQHTLLSVIEKGDDNNIIYTFQKLTINNVTIGQYYQLLKANLNAIATIYGTNSNINQQIVTICQKIFE